MLKKLAWKFLLFASIIIILVATLIANATSQQGTYTNLFEEIATQPTLHHTRSQKFESKGERACRDCLQEFFDLPFANSRLLKNEASGQNLELDCYSPEVGLAVEYQGRQHYEFVPFFHRTQERFESQRLRDAVKAKLCAQKGIRLIRIPYTIPVGQICPTLRQMLLKAGYRPVGRNKF